MNSKRWVIKIGSGVLLDDSGNVDHVAVRSLVDQIIWLRAEGVRVTLISSGAVALGRLILDDFSSVTTLPRLQALAATGQARLIKMYDEAFAETRVAQILITRSDFNDRRRIGNVRMTLEELHRAGVVPIVNENDTVATEELQFGDNDQLASMTAFIEHAELLVILSVASGLRRLNEDHSFGDVIPEVEAHDESLDRWVTNTKSTSGRGGMSSKLSAARFAASCFIPTVVAKGKQIDVLKSIRERKSVGTFFHPMKQGFVRSVVNAEAFRKEWMVLSNEIEGTIVCDAGAKKAIMHDGASLLPAGVVRVEGTFLDGALIRLVDENDEEFARGTSVYTSFDIEKIAGAQSSEIAARLGFKVLDTVIHRDSLIVPRY